MAEERSPSTGILTEEQLTEADEWYSSDGESESECEESHEEQRPPSQELTPTSWQTKEESQWGTLLWHTSQYEDDPLFMERQSGKEMDAEAFLKQLNWITEETDFVDDETASTEKEVEDTSKEPQKTGGESHDLVAMETQGRACGTGSPAVLPVFDDGTRPPEKSKCYYIAHEMMTTERTYVQSLKLLEKVLHGAIKTSRLSGRIILPENGRKEIFLNIGEIYALNFDLLQELEDRIEHWDGNPTIADVLAKRAPFFKLYTMYTSRFDDAQIAYCKWLKSSKSFAELVRTIESSRLCKGLPISSYMLCPIQRIPRYRLLLEDYLRHLPEGHPDTENTRAALVAISAAAVHMNDRIKDLENQAQVVKIQKTFVGKENIVAPGRSYLGRGPVYFVPGLKGRSKKQRVLFLFSDIVLVASITKHGRYRIKHTFYVKSLLVSTLQSPRLENAFCIAERGMTKPFRFCTRTTDERSKWIKELHKAISEEGEKRKTFSSVAKYATLLNDPETNSSILAVLNDPSFEHGHPSWVRRSLRGERMRPSIATLLKDDVDMGGWEVVTEFVSQKEEGDSTRVLRPGIDNTLSSYMNQKSVDKDLWRRRWFVLTSRALICYENHHRDEASGALWLAGYQVSLPEPGDGITRPHVIKLGHPERRPYFFQLPSSYDRDRWYDFLRELLASEANSYQEKV